MKTIQVIVLCFLLVEMCLGLVKKKSARSTLPGEKQRTSEINFDEFDWSQATDYYPNSDIEDYSYDTGKSTYVGGLTFDTEETKTKPDRKSSFAFKSDVSRFLHDFTFDLFPTMIRNESATNAVISPLSIYTALSMLSLGLRGTSKTQTLAILRGQNTTDIHACMDRLSAALFDRNRPNVTLTKANRIFVDRSIQLYKTFKRTLRKNYHASAKKVNFIRQPETSRRRINGFVQRHTKQKIRNLAPSGSITSATRLFIANAMYMKALWLSPFTTTATGSFHISSNEVISTQTMTNSGPCCFFIDADLQAKVVRNPLKGDLSMIMIVPQTAGDFTRLEGSQGKDRIRQALEKTYENGDDWMTSCRISMPKFKIDYTADNLVKVLGEMGVTDIFNPNTADFSGMTPAYKQLYVSDLRHKAFIVVNEDGVEGAAATSVTISARMMPWPVSVDRPFTFIIRDDVTGATLFAGKVVRPVYN